MVDTLSSGRVCIPEQHCLKWLWLKSQISKPSALGNLWLNFLCYRNVVITFNITLSINVFVGFHAFRKFNSSVNYHRWPYKITEHGFEQKACREYSLYWELCSLSRAHFTGIMKTDSFRNGTEHGGIWACGEKHQGTTLFFFLYDWWFCFREQEVSFNLSHQLSFTSVCSQGRPLTVILRCRNSCDDFQYEDFTVV